MKKFVLISSLVSILSLYSSECSCLSLRVAQGKIDHLMELLKKSQKNYEEQLRLLRVARINESALEEEVERLQDIIEIQQEQNDLLAEQNCTLQAKTEQAEAEADVKKKCRKIAATFRSKGRIKNSKRLGSDV